MMEVCRRNGYASNSSGGSHHHHNSAAAPQAVVANFVPSSNGNVTLTFNNQLTNQVPRLMRERSVAPPPPAPPPSFDNLVCVLVCNDVRISGANTFTNCVSFFCSISCTIAVRLPDSMEVAAGMIRFNISSRYCVPEATRVCRLLVNMLRSSRNSRLSYKFSLLFYRSRYVALYFGYELTSNCLSNGYESIWIWIVL